MEAGGAELGSKKLNPSSAAAGPSSADLIDLILTMQRQQMAWMEGQQKQQEWMHLQQTSQRESMRKQQERACNT